MILQINIKQLGSKKKIAPVPFEVRDGISTLRELITELVTICVNNYNERVTNGDNISSLLSDEEINRKAEAGKIAFGIVYSGKVQDITKAVSNAIQCFQDGLYRVFLYENEIEELDSVLELKENDELTIIKLTMLTGRLW